MKHKDLRKINSLIIFIFAALGILYFGASFLIPLTFAAFLAALISPFSNFLEKIGFGRGISCFTSTLIVFIIISGVSYLIFVQLRNFADDLPRNQEQLNEFSDNIQQQISAVTGLSPQEQMVLLQERSESIRGTIETYITNLLRYLVNTSLQLILVMVYLFLFLLYRTKFFDFVMKFVPEKKDIQVEKIIYKANRVIYHYLWGRIKVMIILAAMYIVTFMIFDLPYAVLLTVFGALVTIIPYIGPFISGLLPIVILFIFNPNISEVLLFAAIISLIQLVESYVLEPIIIGNEVQLNPLAVIIAIIAGGMIWGIAGMILFVPLFAIVKIISDHTPNLRPIGFLIGNNKE